MRHEVQLAVADSGGATVRYVLHGTHSESFFGIPATGRRVQVTANVILRIRAGKVTELFGIFDEAGLLRQLGVLPGA